MTSIEWTKVISAAMLPVVLISACSLMSLAFYNRLAAIVARLRAFQRECLNEIDALKKNPDDPHIASRARALIKMQTAQTDGVLRRARLLRSTLICLLTGIALLVLSSIGLGISTATNTLVAPATFLFFCGAFFVLAAVAFALAEISSALGPIEMESDFVREMTNATLPENDRR